MKKIIRKLNILLNKKQKGTMIVLILMMIVGAFLQTAGIGLLVEVVNLVIDPNSIDKS